MKHHCILVQWFGDLRVLEYLGVANPVTGSFRKMSQLLGSPFQHHK